MRMRVDAAKLVPHQDVNAARGRWISESAMPWLAFANPTFFAKARFVEIVYRAGWFDDPIRPLLRFETAKGPCDMILPAPVLGAGAWTGAVPRKTRAVFINPAARTGRFDFRIESIRRVGWAEMLRRTAALRPSKLLDIGAASLFGYRREADNALAFAINPMDFSNFPDYAAAFARPLELGDFDAPRFDWAQGPLFFVQLEGENRAALAQARAALAAQVYKRFEIGLGVDATKPRGHFLIRLQAEDRLHPGALAAFAEEIFRHPDADLLYADEIILEPAGPRPLLKPNWSARLETASSYVGRRCMVRIGARAQTQPRHVRRLLLTRPPEPVSPEPAPASIISASSQPRVPVSIALLTRDRADLLKPCLETLLERTTHPDFELLIVDNGTQAHDALAILARAATDPRVQIASRPGPFNFALFNNEAAARARGQVLVFLNNDMEILTPDWLERLSELALTPEVGAVGALLLFPDGRIQHAGVVLGLGQEAGHFEAAQAPDAPSWLGNARHRREISAVTGACLAVERVKFEGVGGFDAARLPVEFNDVDLCLRLAERGWSNVYAPDVRLIHKESASRGRATFRPLKKYDRERGYFKARWMHVLRDDPYFHPLFSLYGRSLALDGPLPPHLNPGTNAVRNSKKISGF